MYNSPRRNEIPVELVVIDGAMRRPEREGVMIPKAFSDDRVHVGERRFVTEGGQTVSPHNRIEFFVGFPHHFRVECQSQEGALQGRQRLHDVSRNRRQ